MKLSPVGVIADSLWYEIINHAKNVELGPFVVMPNHIHGIIILNGTNDIETRHAQIETRHALSLKKSENPEKTIGQKRFQNQGKNSVSSIIGGYKSAVTKNSRRLGYEFGWQSRFWDNVIKSENDFKRISKYIQNNPKNWNKDKLSG